MERRGRELQRLWRQPEDVTAIQMGGGENVNQKGQIQAGKPHPEKGRVGWFWEGSLSQGRWRGKAFRYSPPCLGE